jgi:hypothetical protein
MRALLSRRLAATALLILGSAALASAAPADYLGQTGAVPVAPPGCNATSPVQIPGSIDLFITRQFNSADDQHINGLGGTPNGCGRVGASRWSLALDRMDWTWHKLVAAKPLLDTTVDAQGHSHAVITGGAMKGAIIRSGYDAVMVIYHGQYLASYECTLQNEKDYGVDGTSLCISVYDPTTQTFDLNRTQVIISGTHANNVRFSDAAVPELLVFHDRIFIYWSAAARSSSGPGNGEGIAVRGAELQISSNAMQVKGSNGRLVTAIDDATSQEVWSPDPADPLSDTTVDTRAIWASGRSVMASASVGGKGCTAPNGNIAGCFRLAIVRSSLPLGKGVFNHAAKIDPNELPTNTQEYTRPMRDQSGNYWLIGHFGKASANGVSDQRIAPGGDFWTKWKQDSALIMFPLTDKSVWPSD